LPVNWGSAILYLLNLRMLSKSAAFFSDGEALSDAVPPGTHPAPVKEQQKSPIFKPGLRSQISIESELSLRKPYLMTIDYCIVVAISNYTI
jgi:hypothetical protein